MGGAGTSPPPRRPAATRGAVGARGAYVTCQVSIQGSIQVCFDLFEIQNLDVRFQWGGGRPDLRIAQVGESVCWGERDFFAFCFCDGVILHFVL